MNKQLLEKIKNTNPLHIIWISVIISELLTAVIVSIMSLLLRGRIERDFILTGIVASFFAAFIIVSIIVFFIQQMGKIEQQLSDSEFNYRTLVDLSPDGVLVHLNGIIVYANQAASHILRAEKKTELIGKTIFTFADANSSKIIEEHLKIINKQSKSSSPLEFSITALDRKKIDIEAIWAHVNYHGKNAVLAVIRDITIRNKMLFRKEETERLLRHEIKNRLNPILNFSERIIYGIKNKEYIEHAKKIHFNAQNIIHMIEHSYNLFQMEEGTFQVQYEIVNILNIFNTIKTNYSKLLNSKKLSMKIYIQDTETSFNDHYEVIGESMYLETLFSNLVLNAIEASPDNETISIRIHNDKQFHEIDIHNFGVIPEEFRNCFFQKYKSSKKTSNMGLGTYISKLIVKTLNGEIYFDTDNAKGTHLIVKLPLK